MHNNQAEEVAIGEVTLPLLTAFQRLIDLLAEPKDIPTLAPIIQREIVYVYLSAIKVRVCARWRRGKSESADRAGHRLVEGSPHRAVTNRGSRYASEYECINLPPSFQGTDGMSPLQYQNGCV